MAIFGAKKKKETAAANANTAAGAASTSSPSSPPLGQDGFSRNGSGGGSSQPMGGSNSQGGGSGSGGSGSANLNGSRGGGMGGQAGGSLSSMNNAFGPRYGDGTSPPLNNNSSNFPNNQQQLSASQSSFQPNSSTLSQSSNPNINNNHERPGPPPASSQTVLYPWALRPLHLLPSSLLSPPDNSLHPSQPQGNVWGPLSAPPFPRYGHSVNPVASSPSGDLYVFGGLVANSVKNDLYVMGCTPGGSGGNASGANGPPGMLSVGMVETRGEVPGPRVGHASVGVGNVLIVWGGDTKSRPDDRQDDGLYLLNLSSREWTRVKTIGPVPEGRYGHAAAMVGSKFFVFGGQKDDGGFMNDLVWFDLQKLKAGQPKWTFVDYGANALAPPKRTGHTTVTHGDCIYVFGGTDGQYHYNDTWCYDTNTQIWVELSCIGYIPVPREGHAATLVDDVMYVFGGRGVDGKDLEDLAAFKITTQRWFMFQNMGPAPSGRSGHAMATFQNKVYVLGGESYTSQQSDDPAFVHVLDTSKIKYPADNTRQNQAPISRKSSIPLIPPPITSSNLPNLNPALQSPPFGSSEFRSIPEEQDLRRAPSPPAAARGGVNGATSQGSSKSFGQVIGQGPPPINAMSNTQPQSLAKIGKRSASGASSPPPIRPARPGDDLAFRSTSDRNGERPTSPITTQQLQRSISPPLLSPSESLSRSNGKSSTPTPTNRLVRSPSPNSSQARQAGSVSSDGTEQRDPSHSYGLSPAMSNGNSADGFYYGPKGANGAGGDTSAALKAKDDEIAALVARESWMKTTLAIATRRGFVPSESSESSGSKGVENLENVPAEEGGSPEVMEALVRMKQELAKAKLAMSDQAHLVDQQVAGASRARAAALQEASYYRSKLAALESGTTGDVGRVEKERIQELEKKLAEALQARSVLERQVEESEKEKDHQLGLRSSAEEHHSSALDRANAAESSYSRSLTDYADLQRRANSHESTIQEHFEQIAGLTSTADRLSAENAHLKERTATSDASLAQYLRTLEETQLALSAANIRNDETHSVWQESQTSLAEHQSRTRALEAELSSKHHEVETATARSVDLERVLKVTRDEHEATKIFAAGGLADLVAAHRDGKLQSTEPSELHSEQMKSLETEAETYRKMHQDSRAKGEATFTELNDCRLREIALQTQLIQLRSEIATLRSQHTRFADELGRSKAAASNQDLAIRDAGRAKEAAEVKSSLLRNLLTDHGLSVDDEELASRYPPMNGSESPEQLHRRVQDLEARLEQQNRAQTQLEESHEDSKRGLVEASQDKQVQLDHLNKEVVRLRATSDTDSQETERSTKVSEELEALQRRHGHLEQTHMKAVQYVKGTEKMVRRMKEDLTRYKERNETLETEAKGHSERAIPEELKTEIESMRLQMQQLSASSTKAALENEELLRRMTTLQTDYERKLQEQSVKSHTEVEALRSELVRLDTALGQAHHELEETLAVNNSLNQELTAALKSSTTSPRPSPGGNDSEIRRLETELTTASNKAEWLKRENTQLESRCRTAEEKISVLLDHFEESSAAEPTFDGAANHRWTHESGISRPSFSDEDSEYSEGDRTRTTAGASHRT